MHEQRFETGKSPQVTVNACGGSLTVGSWKGTAVLANGSDFNGQTDSVDEITLSSAADLTLTVPEKASLRVASAQGAVIVKHVDGAVHIGTANGAVTLRDVGQVKLEMVNGRFNGENINSSLILVEAQEDIVLRNVSDVAIHKAAASVAVHYANGDLLLEQVAGAITLHTISGDLIVRQAGEATLSNLGGKNEIGGIEGILQLVGGLVNGEHHFQANGDIYVAWPPDAPITLVTNAALIDNQLRLSNAATTTADNLTTLTGHIENGKPFVSLKTPSRIGLKPLRGDKPDLTTADFDFTPPPPTLAEIVDTAVRQHLPDATPEQIKQIAAAIQSNLETHPISVKTAAETVAPPLPSAGKIAAEKAQRKVEKSLQNAQDTMAQAEAKLTQPTPEPEPIPEPEPEIETAVVPSQTQILQLMQDGRITLEQANILLNQL